MSDPGGRGTRSAFVEVAVVVAGILIAFGVDASWDASRDRAREREALEGLVVDLTVMRDDLVGRLEFKRTLAHASQRVLEAGLGGTPIPSDSLRTYGHRVVSWGAVELAGGRVETTVVGDESLQGRLAVLNGMVSRLHEKESKTFDWVLSEIYTLVPDGEDSMLAQMVVPELVNVNSLDYLTTPAAVNAIAARWVLEDEAMQDIRALMEVVDGLIADLQ